MGEGSDRPSSAELCIAARSCCMAAAGILPYTRLRRYHRL
jgi:hypothetical protein